MIYGEGSKGNYPLLVKFAKISLFFQDIDNQRSMLYIDDLCEFIKFMISNEEKNIFFSQNVESLFNRKDGENEMMNTSVLANIIGVVFNRVELKGDNYYYYGAGE